MEDDHAPVGLLIAAIGAVMLALSVFAPWYRVTITAQGAAAPRTELAVATRPYASSAFQARLNAMGPRLNALAGRQIATESPKGTLKRDTLILLGIAAVAFLASLLRLANTRGLLFATGNQIALMGGAAFLLGFFRTLWRPGAAVNQPLVMHSLGWGIWLALVSAAAIVGGAFMAGSDRAGARTSAKRGPGPPPLMTPPSIQAIAQAPPSRRATRRR
ncbi:MAG: hypothetical protein QOG85_1039 [Gaiellaceae bacterium]|nr:hypothetical protein [Gaiellaceae bacterium]